MKKLDLNALGVEEMVTSELENIDGGLMWFVVGVATAVLFDILLNPSNTASQAKKGFDDGFNSVNL